MALPNAVSHDTPEAPLARPVWRSRHSGLALLGFLALTVLLFHDAWAHPTDVWIGAPSPDPVVVQWMLAWTPSALLHVHNPLVSTYMGYPRGFNLMLNAWVPLVGVLMAPITLTLGPIAAYNVAVTAGVALSAWVMYVALHRWVRNHAAAAVGALLYGFSPYVLYQATGRLHVMIAITPPLILMLLDDLIVRQRRRPVTTGVLLGLTLTAQFLISEEVLASEAVVFALGIMVLAASHPRAVAARAPGVLKGSLTAVVVTAFLVAYPLKVQLFGPNRFSGGIFAFGFSSTDLANVVASPLQLFNPLRHFIDPAFIYAGKSEITGYIGVPLLVLLLWAAVRERRRPEARAAAILFTLTLVISLGPHLVVAGQRTQVPLPWLVLQGHISPDLLASRFSLYVMLWAAILVALFLDRMRWRPWRRPRPLLVIALTGACAASLMPPLPFMSAAADVPPYFTSRDVQAVPAGSVAYVAPPSSATDAEAMKWQEFTAMRYRMTSGLFIGPSSTGTAMFGAPLSLTDATLDRIIAGEHVEFAPALHAALEEDLRTLKVETVIVGPMPHEDEAVRLFTDLIGRPPMADRGVFVWYSVGPSYGLRP